MAKRSEPEFEELYLQYRKPVYSYLLAICRDAHLAEEATQETFFRALKAIGRFRGECPVNVWLCRIARNTLMDMLRRAGRETELEPDEAAPAPETPESALESREAALALHRALHSLPEPYREVFWLRSYGELPFAEIALLFDKNENWARVTFYRAKLKLKEELK